MAENSDKNEFKEVEEEMEHVAKEVQQVATKVERGILGTVEEATERILFSARWLLMPLYVGLATSLLIVVYKFVTTFYETIVNIRSLDLHNATLEVLQLLDITLLGNLIVIIIFSGYENFVSKISVAEDSVDRPGWMGKVDYSGLKIKLIGSLVAISVIELLRDFMNANEIVAEAERWRIGIHITFVLSGVLFAIMDYIADKRTAFELDVEKKDLELEKLRYEVNQFKMQHKNEHYKSNSGSMLAD